MLDPGHLLRASAAVEQVLWVLVALLVVLLLLRAARAPASIARPRLEISVRAEGLAMLAVLAWVLVTRLAGRASPQQPQHFFSEMSVVYVADALQKGDLWRHWLGQLRNVQVLFEYLSPIQAPVLAVLERTVGIAIELPTIDGAIWAVVAVLLAWRLGRAVEGPTFGVLFAAVVAAAPLQLAWGRLGGIHIGGPAAVLFALWTGWLAGRRGGVVVAFLAGVVAWSCVYYYFAARVGMALAFVALWAAWRRSGRSVGRFAGLATVAAFGLVTCLMLHRTANPGQSVWPMVTSYVGGSGEVTLADMVRSAVAAVWQQASRGLRIYFWSDRVGHLAQQLAAAPSPWIGTLRAPGMTNGGLVLVPVLILGVIGLVRCLRHPIERGLWLALAVGGALPGIIAPPTARRFLVFDIGWCAFTAIGLQGLLESRLLAPATVSARLRWGGLVVAALGLWTAVAVGLSWAVLPSQHVWIPFAESGFGDATTCLGCIASGRAWQEEIEADRMVILLDTDLYRENATSPGALPLYGKIAALATGRPDRFFEYYTIVSNVDWLPPRPGLLGPAAPDDVAAALAARIEAAKPAAIVWWFSQPNAWERSLADALVQAGSSRTTPPPRPVWGTDRVGVTAEAIRVETPWERRHEALGAVRRLVDPASPPSCMRLERVATRALQKWPLVVASIDGGGDAPPQWAFGSFDMAEVFGVARPAGDPQILVYSRAPDGTRSARAVDFWGTSRQWTSDGAERPGSPVPGPRPLGRDCLALQDGQWWAVDPVAGTLHAAGGPPPWAPPGVVGVTLLGDALVLATADQRLHVADPVAGRIVRSFPAMVVPARRFHFGECANVAAGNGWIASLDPERGLLFFYDPDGTPLGRLSLARAVGSQPFGVRSLRASGDYLGVGHDASITTLRVVRDPGCPAVGPVDAP